VTTDNIIQPVRDLGAYTLKATVAPIKLNQNESPVDVDEAFKREVLDRVAARAWNRYPDFYPRDVLDGLGALHGLSGDSVLLGNGSNELIQALFAATVEAGTRVALPSPTFTLYAMMVAANGGEVVHVPLADDLTYDVDAWRALADRGDTHLLVCSPNNPTGSVMDAAQIADLAGRTQRLVIVDEAYAQFGPHDLAPLVAAHPNVAVLRTFSKAVGLAAVRLGYLLCAPDLAREIGKVKLPYNVGVFGLEVARVCLEAPHRFDGIADTLRAERARLVERLTGLAFDDVYPGAANFVLVRTPRAAEVFDALYADGILVRNVGHYPMLANCLRISVGTPAENDAVVARLTALLGAAPTAEAP